MKMKKQVLKILRKWFKKNKGPITYDDIIYRLTLKYPHLDITELMVKSTMINIHSKSLFPGLGYTNRNEVPEYYMRGHIKPKKVTNYFKKENELC